ncbi:MAG TPA: DMT family transporter [Candidatus Nitrosotenuis sp.]|jgi:drug/metabolite transporter (DMT)-like permease|nr:DMT family transporter [Candidatus Nitrosotenuis sp.]
MTHTLINPIDKIKAVFWVLGWCLALSLGMALTKTLPAGLPSALVVAIRCWFGFLVLCPVLLQQGPRKIFSESQVFLNILRGLITCAAMGCTYYAYRHLPLAYASAIGQSGPLFTTVLAIVLLQERVTGYHWGLLFLGYCGVVIMVQPTVHGIDGATIAALAANLLAGLAIVLARHLSQTHGPVTLISYSTGVAAFVMMIIGWIQWQMPSLEQWGILALIGILGVSSQYSYVKALKYGPASFVAPFEYTRLCIAIPIGYVFFDEVPKMSTLLGSLIITGVAIVLLKLEAPRQVVSQKSQS